LNREIKGRLKTLILSFKLPFILTAKPAVATDFIPQRKDKKGRLKTLNHQVFRRPFISAD